MPSWSELIPDESQLLLRKWFKDYGTYSIAAPASEPDRVDVGLIRISTVAVGSEGEYAGYNGAFAHAKRVCAPGEVFELQVGRPGTAGPNGDSWLRRQATGEVLCYADRGRGAGVHGSAAKSIGDIVRSGVAGRSGSDAGDAGRLGFGGIVGANRVRAPGPGGGGYREIYPGSILFAAGHGLIAVEFYAGDPGEGY